MTLELVAATAPQDWNLAFGSNRAGFEAFAAALSAPLDAARLALGRTLSASIDAGVEDPDGARVSASLVKEYRALLDSVPTDDGGAADVVDAFPDAPS